MSRGARRVVAALLPLLAAAPRWSAPQSACPVPRPGRWAAVRDTLWPLLEHRAGDQAWAHRDSVALPRESATWCNPLVEDQAALDAGRSIYTQHCEQCHGAAGRGDGPGAGGADPEPYDFTRPEFAGMREPPGSALLYAILTRGIEGTLMAGYAAELGPWERLAVLAYVARFPGPAALRARQAWADSLARRRLEHR